MRVKCVFLFLAASTFGSTIEEVTLLGTTPIGEPCTVDDDCVAYPGRSECSLIARCRCLLNYISQSDRMDCIPVRNQIGDSCKERPQCTSGTPSQYSDCINGRCACTEEGVTPPGQHVCLKKALTIGEPCGHDVQCTENLSDFSFCRSGATCDCKSTGVPSSNRRSCLKIVNVIGENCEEPQQCQEGVPGPLSDCLRQGLDKVCGCREDSVKIPNGHKCLLKATKVGDACESSIQCTEELGQQSECVANRCECTAGEGVPSYDNSECLPVVNELRKYCLESPQCQHGVPGEWSECAIDWSIPSRFCNCSQISLEQDGSHKCYLKAVQLGDACEVEDQCSANLGHLTKCDGGSCDCVSGAVPHPSGTHCLQGLLPIGSPCEHDVQCVEHNSGLSTCNLAGRCSCKPDYTSSNNLMRCLKICNNLGDECEERQQCQQGIPGAWSECQVSVINPPKTVCNCTPEAITDFSSNICYKKAEFVGDQCEIQDQCVVNLEYSLCLGGECHCFDNFVPSTDKTKCIPKAFLGDSCFDEAQCSHIPQSSSCLPIHPENPGGGSTCQCNAGYWAPPGSNDKCFQLAEELGETCDHHAYQCSLIPDAICAGQKCTCNDVTHVPSVTAKKCLPKVLTLNRTCEEDVQCVVEFSLCQPNEFQENLCTCTADEYVESEIRPGTCVEIVKDVNEPCAEHRQCTAGLGEHAECFLNLCKCKTQYDPYEGQCYLSAELGEGCTIDEECHAGSSNLTFCHPIEQVCRCHADDALEHENNCLSIALKVGDPCEIGAQCKPNLGDLSDCSLLAYKCDCFNGSVASGDLSRCLPGNQKIGESCTDTTQCVGQPNSECGPTGQCSCRSPNFIPSGSLDDCLPIVNTLGGECLERQQCQQGVPGPLSDCFDKSETSGKTCNCTTEAVTVPGQNKCYKKAEQVSDPCEVHDQCIVTLGHSHCLASKCECTTNATASTDKLKCLLKAYLGDDCVDEVQCSHIPESASCLRNSTSEGHRTCQCNEGFLNPPGNNWACHGKAEFIGDSCELDPVQCDHVKDSLCDPETRTCECNENLQVVSGDRKRCLDKLTKLNETCEESLQCLVENSECLLWDGEEDRKACRCNSTGFVESVGNPGKCLEVIREVNMPCLETVQCVGGIGLGSECRGGVCQCGFNYEQYEGRCYFPVRLGGFCNQVEECYVGVNNLTICSPEDSRCRCIPEAFEQNGLCFVHKLIGDTCTRNEECLEGIQGNARCDPISSTCQCANGFLNPPGNNRNCYRMAEFVGESCELHPIQCKKVNASLCELEKWTCECNENLQLASGDRRKCLNKVTRLNETCEEGLQCLVDNSDCRPRSEEQPEKVCLCDPARFVESVINPGRCVKKIEEVNLPCSETVQCVGGIGPGSECRAGVCQCSFNYERYEGRCYFPVRLGGVCHQVEECYVGVNNLTICSPDDSRCRCIPEAFEQNGLCFVHKLIGDTCTRNEECLEGIQGNARCDPISSTCQCANGFLNPPGNNRNCYRMAEFVGESCELHPIQCEKVNASLCESERWTCECNENLQLASGDRRRCLDKVTRLNETCEEGLQCLVDNSDCRLWSVNEQESFCRCKFPQFVESLIAPGGCLKVMDEINFPCTEDIQCVAGIGAGSECRGTVCQCANNYMPFERRCYFPARLGGFCRQIEECYVGVNNLTVCDTESSRCVCSPNAVETDGSCVLKKEIGIGSACTKDEECLEGIQGIAFCDPFSRTCQCAIGFIEANPNHCVSSGDTIKMNIFLIMSVIFIGMWK